MKNRVLFALLAVVLLFVPAISHAASGDLDRSYGVNGFAYAADADSSAVMTIQADDKVIAGGQCTVAGRKHFCLTRYLSNGAVDTTFGTAGRVATAIGDGESVLRRVVVLPDGRILAVGYTSVQPQPPSGHYYFQFAVARYLANGSPDISLDGDGVLTNPMMGLQGASASDVAVQPDGKFVVVGTGTVLDKCFVAARFNPDGSLDQSFADAGVFAVNIGGSGGAYATALQPDGKILVAGLNDAYAKFMLIRLTPAGFLDGTFAGSGFIDLPGPGQGNNHMRKVSVLPDGKIMVLTDFSISLHPWVALYRINSNGTFDSNFDGDGRLVNNILPEYECEASDFQIQPNGKIVVAARGSHNGNSFSVSGRYRANGTLDRQFGTSGALVHPTGHQSSGVVIQSDGKIVYGSNTYSGSPSGYKFFLARYLNNGTRDSDFNGDRKSDLSVYRPSLATWYLTDGGTGFSSTPFGLPDDRIVPADYDGDGRIDIGVFRAGIWYLLTSSNGAVVSYSFGQSGDVPVPADYDGDDKADIAVFRQGYWYIINSGDNSFRAEQFGQMGDRPVIGNFDGDRRSDLAVYRGGTWYVNGSTAGFSAVQFGLPTDRPVVGDYDSDGKSDFAVYRDGDWYILRSFAGFYATHFGIGSDVPIPGEYDGDGRTDLGVFRDGTWFTLGSLGSFNYTHFGSPGDIPVPSAFLP